MTGSHEHTGQPSATHLFTVRVWRENSAAEMRFHAMHILSGESRLFSDGEEFLQYLSMKMAEEEKGHRLP